ncbi:MAG: hypothetical protein IKC01_05325 [Clostridia bacterium]|nr:hypothetical protein [Clostridia bacterium]
MKSIKLRSNFGKIYIEKLPSYLMMAIMGAIFARCLFLFVSRLLETVPFICYDDLYIYSAIEEMSAAQIKNRIVFRNIYPMISMILNPYHIGEYISAARLLNAVVFILMIVKLDKIAEMVDVPEKTKKALALVFAFSPYFIIYSMVQLREVLCAYFVVYLFWAFISFEKKRHFSWVKTLIIAALLYYTRTYVLEVIVAIIALYKAKDSKWYVKLMLALFLVAAVGYFLSDADYMYVLNDKIEFYVTEETLGGGFLSRIEVTGIENLYNLFLLLPFVQISPLPSSFQTEYYDSNSWAAIITYASGIAAFFVPYFWLNTIRVLFSKESQVYSKLMLLFYLAFVGLIAIIEPQNARFMFFTIPIFYFFGVDGFIKIRQENPKNIIWGLLFMFVPYLYILI